MAKIVKLTEQDLNYLVGKILYDSELNEGIFDGVKDFYRGIKGIYRGYGKDYFQNMSRLENLILKLKKLDAPNTKIMTELSNLQSKVSNLNIPQQRKDNLIMLIKNSIYHFNNYDKINDQILSVIKTLNLDKWK